MTESDHREETDKVIRQTRVTLVKGVRTDGNRDDKDKEMDIAGGGEETMGRGNTIPANNDKDKKDEDTDKEIESNGRNMENVQPFTIKDWMRTTQRGWVGWMSLIINNGDGLILDWPPGMEDEQHCVRYALRDSDSDFWYATIGGDAIVAAGDMTKAFANMERIKRALVTHQEGDFYHHLLHHK